MDETGAASPYKYWAFISYSHQDSAWAAWLHRKLEGYVVPGRLVGQAMPGGTIPRRLYPVFRDRDELSSSPELSTVLNEALDASRYQIVICSPRSAGSRWVDEEIRHFKSRGRADRILCLIVDGEPNADATLGQQECFPAALRFQVRADRSLGDEPAEPIAADARPHRDGRDDALLKLVAGMLGIGFDALKQRDRQQRFWRRLRLAAAVLAGVVVLGGFWQHVQRQQAKADRHAMLDRLFELGRQEALRGNQARAATYLGKVYSEGEDSPGLRFLLARALPAVEAQAPTVFRLANNPQVGLTTFSHDGRRLFTVAEDTIAVWDAASGQRLAQTAPYLSSDRESILISPDDSAFVYETNPTAFSANFKVSIYDTATAKLRAIVPGQTSAGQARGSAYRSFSPDGQRLLVLDGQRQARLIDSTDGRTLRTFDAADKLASASFSADGLRLVTGDQTGEIRIWNAADGKVLRRFSVHPKLPTRAFFADHDRRIYTANTDGALKVYDVASGQLEDALGGHAANIETAMLSADGARLLTAARDGAKLWDLANGRQLLALAFEPSMRAGIDLRPDGRQIVAMLDQTRVGVWDVAGRKLIATLEGHTSAVDAVRYSPDGQQLVTGSNDGSARLWDIGALQAQPLAWLAHEVPISESDVSGTVDASFSHNGELLATTGADGMVRLWDGHDGKPLRVLAGHSRTTRQVSWSADDQRLASASTDGSTRLWNADDGRALATLTGHTASRVHTALWSPDGSRLLTIAGNYEESTADISPRLLDAANGTLVALLRGHTHWVFPGAAFSRDGSLIATASEDHSANIWDAHDGHLRATLKAHTDEVLEASFSGDGKRVATASTDGSAIIWDSASGAELKRLTMPELGGFGYARYSADSTQVALCSQSGICLLWNPDSGAVQRLVGHTAVSYWAQFSPDGTLLATASTDGTARLWDVQRARVLFEFAISTRYGYLQKAAFSPDGLRLATAGQSTPATAELWDIHAETRGPADIAAILRCKSPWMVEAEHLVPREHDDPACHATLATPANP